MRSFFLSFHFGDTTNEVSLSLTAPDIKGDDEHLKGIPLPPNPAQVPNPIQPHGPKDNVPAEAVLHHQSEFSRSALKEWNLCLAEILAC